MSHTELWPIFRIAATVVSGAPEVIAETAQQRMSRRHGRLPPGEPVWRNPISGQAGRRGPSGRRGPHAGPAAEKGRLRKSTAICDLPPRLRDFQRIFWIDNPVTLPAGRAKLATRPLPIGSVARAKTIGIDEQIHLRLVSS